MDITKIYQKKVPAKSSKPISDCAKELSAVIGGEDTFHLLDNHAQHEKEHVTQKQVLLQKALRKMQDFNAVKNLEAHIELHRLYKADPNLDALRSVYMQYANVYTGLHIKAALDAYRANDFATAAKEFDAAKNGFQPERNAKEYGILEAWQKSCEAKGGKTVSDAKE